MAQLNNLQGIVTVDRGHPFRIFHEPSGNCYLTVRVAANLMQGWGAESIKKASIIPDLV